VHLYALLHRTEVTPLAHPLRGVYLKTNRAKKHIRAIRNWFETTFKGDTHVLIMETEPDGLHKVLRIGMPHDVPDEILATIGDAIHNLRSALDHLACAIAVKRNASTSIDDVAFAFGKNEKAFLTSSNQRKIAKLGADGIRFVHSFQPYYGGNGAKGNTLLWALHALDITDKHRALLTTGLYSAVFPSGSKPNISQAAWKPLEEKVEIARWPVEEPQPNVTYALSIAFNEPPLSPEDPMLNVLDNFVALVEYIVHEAERHFFQ
jgi:hypothetical protein